MKDIIYTLLLFFYSFINPDLYDTEPPIIGLPEKQASILIFSKTQESAFRHKTIEQGISIIQAIAEDNGWQAFATENGAVFNKNDLKKFSTVIFLSTAGNILSISQKNAFEDYVNSGGGFLGIHAASDTEHHWRWYKKALAGMYSSHVPPREATLIKEFDHPTVQALPPNWNVTDEWYFFLPSPRKNATILASIEPHDNNELQQPSPVIWFQQIQQGRFYYTALGHTPEIYDSRIFRQHIRDAIAWTGKLTPTAVYNDE